MTEEQRYTVLQKHGDVELREYAAHTLASVTVSGSVEQAANAAFRPLFNYISGQNHGSESPTLDSATVQRSVGEQLSMTAPVIQEAAGTSHWTVSFVLPGTRAFEEYPVPNDPQVRLRAMPVQAAAALRWSGRWTPSNIAKWTQELQQQIDDAGWDVAGEARWTRFDPPWMPPFARRNEIVIPVSVAERNT